MNLIDTHAHVNFKAFSDDAEEVILNSLNNGIGIILVGSDFKTSRRALDLANKYEKGVWASIGLHPVHLEGSTEMDENGARYRLEEFNYDNYEKLASFEKIVAIGEIGLDYHHLKLNENLLAAKKKQKEIFWQQLLLARRLDLPAIIHCRVAHDDMFSLLTEFKEENKDLIRQGEEWGVVHCFSGDENLAWKYFSLGLLISFTGLVTFSRQWDSLIRKMPIDKFMVETDCPYMTPEPFRGQRNEPILVSYVAKRIAEIRGTTFEKIAEISLSNSKRLFNIM